MTGVGDIAPSGGCGEILQTTGHAGAGRQWFRSSRRGLVGVTVAMQLKRKGSVKRNSARAARDVEYVSDVYAARARHSVSAVKRLCLNSWRPTR